MTHYVGNAPPVVITTREQKWEEMKHYRERLLNGGVQYNGHWYYTDNPSLLEFLNLKVRSLERVIEGKPLDVKVVIGDSPTYIKTMDNGYMEVTWQDIIGVHNAIEIKRKQIYTMMAYHREQMLASNDFLNYNYKTGFPACFDGVIPSSPTE